MLYTRANVLEHKGQSHRSESDTHPEGRAGGQARGSRQVTLVSGGRVHGNTILEDGIAVFIVDGLGSRHADGGRACLLVVRSGVVVEGPIELGVRDVEERTTPVLTPIPLLPTILADSHGHINVGRPASAVGCGHGLDAIAVPELDGGGRLTIAVQLILGAGPDGALRVPLHTNVGERDVPLAARVVLVDDPVARHKVRRRGVPPLGQEVGDVDVELELRAVLIRNQPVDKGDVRLGGVGAAPALLEDARDVEGHLRRVACRVVLGRIREVP
mmetsp:Transcript_31212/g.76551  ORF Transcript_31212/g.76551 Transcript_31212/m.76551 type:complete len:272 (+) Transcript_31212:245-1060(+)